MSLNGHKNPWDTTSNAGILVPPLVYLQLKCKVMDPTAIVLGRHQIVSYAAVPFSVDYEAERLLFTPLRNPEPPWRVISGFIQGTHVLEAYTPTGESLVMWDLDDTEYRPGEEIIPTIVTMWR